MPTRAPRPAGSRGDRPDERGKDETARAGEARETAQPRRVLFPLGVGYYPLTSEMQSWSDWYERDPDTDFATFASAQFTMVRLFISWRYFEPQVGLYSDEALDRLDALVGAARTRKLQLVVTFFADDRLSELSDLPWGKKRDPRTDQYLIQREAALVQHIVTRYRSEPAIFAWALGNEAFLTGFSDAEALTAWTRTLHSAIRETDPEHPVLLGCDPETLRRETGMDARAAVDACEVAVAHVTSAYRAYAAEGPIDSGPATYLDSFLLRSAARGLPVLLDDAGVHSLDSSPAEEAAYIRTVLYSALMNRAAGVILRRDRDLTAERREPYFRDPYEVLVGIADAEGVPKTAFGEARAFARVAAHVDLRRYLLTPERTAVVLPTERYAPLPSLAGLFDPRACLQAYICVKEAHVPVTLVRESDAWKASVLIVPSARDLEADTWERLAGFVQGGASVFMSYGGGDAHPVVREIFGVEFLGDHGMRPSLSCRVAQQGLLGRLESFDVPLECPHYALLGHGGATVVATDDRGAPLLTVNRFGQGRAAYCAVPIERALAQGDTWAAPAPVKAMVREVYASLAAAAGCGSPVGCDVPEVEVALFSGDDEDVLVLLNHSPEKVTATLTTERVVASIADVRGGAATEVGASSFGVPLGPNGATALRLAYR